MNNQGSMHQLSVAVDSPFAATLTYLHESPLPEGSLVRVPLGKREMSGVVCAQALADVGIQAHKLKPILQVFECLPPLSKAWLDLANFAASYYQRGLGELALAALPLGLREGTPASVERAMDKLIDTHVAVCAGQEAALAKATPPRHASLHALGLALLAAPPAQGLASSGMRELHAGANAIVQRWLSKGMVQLIAAPTRTPRLGAQARARELSAQQSAALATINSHSTDAAISKPLLLWGATGSGKTEVYLRAAAAVLERDASAQILILVPEINLTPQLQAQFEGAFEGAEVVALHSGLSEGERLRAWLKAHLGIASIMLGTRMAVFASLPRLALIMVDEEHDASFKSQEGARYSARDLAVYRATQAKIPIVLGSATPSLESWLAAQRGRYTRIDMPERISDAPLPSLRLVNARQLPREQRFAGGLSTLVCEAIEARLAKQPREQTLIFLNRRGYAPVISCAQCGWLSDCMHCSAYQVFHKADRSLRCHHCSTTRRVPVACPACGSHDLRPVGHGTQKLEEWLTERFPTAHITRIDADTSRRKGAAAAAFAQVHAGETDILLGTQMVTKGHDFRGISLIVALGADSALYSADFRASERLFAQLMQAAGRAGRSGLVSEMWVQTDFVTHPLFTALKTHDYASFAALTLQEREMAGMPPFSFLALMRAEAKTQIQAQDFLKQAREQAQALATEAGITLYAPVPMSMQRIADVERAQMLMECTNRKALQGFLQQWIAQLKAQKTAVRWAVDIDPLEI
jgi:primosomal protein N' (replication factor Y) (superfamily II helicase)